MLTITGKFIQQAEKVRVDPNLQQILSKTGGSISLNINSSGQTALNIVAADGEVLANKEDMKKVLTMSSFINTERKGIEKETVNLSFKKMLYALKSEAHAISEDFQDKVIPRSFLDLYRPVQAQMKNLTYNLGEIEKCSANEAQKTVKGYLAAQGVHIYNATTEFLIKKFSDDDKEMKLNDFLFARNIPIWVFRKLTATRLPPTTPSTDVVKVLFPKDESKGFSVSFKEIRSATFVNAQGGVLTNNEAQINLFQSNVFVRHFCNIDDDVDLDDPKNEVAKTLQGVPILVCNGMANIEDVIHKAAAQNGKSYSWTQSFGLNPRNNLQFLGTLYKRMATLSYSKVNREVELIETLFSPFKYDRTIKSGLMIQLKDWFDKTSPEAEKLSYSCFTREKFQGKGRALTGRCLSRLLEIETPSRDLDVLRVVIGGTKVDAKYTYSNKIPSKLSNGVRETTNAFKDLQQKAESFTDTSAVNSWVERYFDANLGSKTRKSGVTTTMIQSKLGPQSRQLIRRLVKNKLNAAAGRISDWLRTFMNQKLQDAVAVLLDAKYEDFFDKSVEYSKGDLAAYVDVHEDETDDEDDRDEPDASDDESQEGDPEIPPPDEGEV